MKKIDRYISEKLKINKDSEYTKKMPKKDDKVLVLQMRGRMPAAAYPSIIKSISGSEFTVEYIGTADEIPIFQRADHFKMDDNPINRYIGICKDDDLKNFICYPADFCLQEINISDQHIKIDGNTVSIPTGSTVFWYKQKLLNHFKDK